MTVPDEAGVSLRESNEKGVEVSSEALPSNQDTQTNIGSLHVAPNSLANTPSLNDTFVPNVNTSAQGPNAGTLLNERFRLLRELGRGGMATVYLAEEVNTGRQVAVKMMHTRLEGTARQRFTREFSTIASVKHPSCVEVFEYGESANGPFFAMELFAGEPATALIGQPLVIALKALYHVAEALDYVHGRRIIHRDIKPGNILVRCQPEGSGFDVRLTDFGLAKFANTSSSLSGEGNFVGTIAYCAPEQIMRDELDYRCDIYSFGVVCYEVLAGRHPFSEARGSVQAIIAKHLLDLPQQVRTFNRDVSPEVEAAVMQMLSKAAGNRPPSTLAFRQAIASFMEWETGHEKPEAENESRGMVVAFVSRKREEQLLESLLAENLLIDRYSALAFANEQPPFLALLTGEAGIGKSTLLRQVARIAMANGAKVYEGRCFEGNLAPFQPFVEIIRQLLIERAQSRSKASSSQDEQSTQPFVAEVRDSTAVVDRIVQNYTPELLRIAPELKDLLRGEAFVQAESAQQSDYVLRAIARFFVDLGKLQPICLLLEDLHWADNSSMSLLVYLGAALRAARRESAERGEIPPRLFVCATTRPEADYPTLTAPMNDLRQQDNQRTIELNQFDQQDVCNLAAALLGALPDEIDDPLVERITTQCFGNPFYVSQTIREWKRLGRIVYRSRQWRMESDGDESARSIPDSVRTAMRERVRGLEPLPGKMLSVAAVIGAVVDIELLRDVLGHSDQFEFLDALDLLVARQILNETGQARRVTFSHDLIREAALERQSSKQQTQRLHEAVALRLESLAQEGKAVSNAKLAEHFLSAEIHPKAFHYLLQAGSDAVSAFAHRDAIQVLEKARQILPTGTAAALEYQLYFQLGKAYAAALTPLSAEAMFREAVRTAEQPSDRAEALLGLGEVLARRRQPEEALNAFQKALREVRHPLHTNPISTVFDITVGMMFTFLLPEALRRKMKFRVRSQLERSLAFRITLTASHTQLDDSLFRYLQLCQLVFIRSHQTGAPGDLALGYSKQAMNLCLYGLPFLPLRYSNRAMALASTAMRPEIEAFTQTQLLAVKGLTDNASRMLGDAEDSLKAFERLGESYSRQLMTHVTRHLCEFVGDAKRELVAADEESRMAVLSDDWERTTWGLYGRADALARAGELSEARREMDKALELLGDNRSIVARPVAVYTDAFVSLQESEYQKAFSRALESQWLTQRYLGVFLFNSHVYPLAVEAGLGPNWHDPNSHSKIRADRKRMRQISWVLWKCLGIGALFKVTRAHCFRVRGRHAFVMGNIPKALRFLDRAILSAQQHGLPYDRARALLDRSLINGDTAPGTRDREEGQSLLKELHSVLPKAEQLAFG